ncbi:DddA-like double-stranded DNA deaminase toxin [Streptomyces sp. NBC_01278]|uniref:DddA-like double-stranded DNA deaminase toxin n=1 Tax=Streptomyces sp. NBC_01278 TaxID=2903809 RepID=UPI003FCC97E8
MPQVVRSAAPAQRGRFPVASHVEAKIAWAMRNRRIQRATVAINKEGGVYSGPFSCPVAVRRSFQRDQA